MLEIIQLLGQGFVTVFEPQNLLLIIAGCALGLFIGAMPGLGSVIATDLPGTAHRGDYFPRCDLLRRDVRWCDFIDHARHSGCLDRGGNDL